MAEMLSGDSAMNAEIESGDIVDRPGGDIVDQSGGIQTSGSVASSNATSGDVMSRRDVIIKQEVDVEIVDSNQAENDANNQNILPNDKASENHGQTKEQESCMDNSQENIMEAEDTKNKDDVMDSCENIAESHEDIMDSKCTQRVNADKRDMKGKKKLSLTAEKTPIGESFMNKNQNTNYTNTGNEKATEKNQTQRAATNVSTKNHAQTIASKGSNRNKKTTNDAYDIPEGLAVVCQEEDVVDNDMMAECGECGFQAPYQDVLKHMGGGDGKLHCDVCGEQWRNG